MSADAVTVFWAQSYTGIAPVQYTCSVVANVYQALLCCKIGHSTGASRNPDALALLHPSAALVKCWHHSANARLLWGCARGVMRQCCGWQQDMVSASYPNPHILTPCPWAGRSQFGPQLATLTCAFKSAGTDPSSPIWLAGANNSDLSILRSNDFTEVHHTEYCVVVFSFHFVFVVVLF